MVSNARKIHNPLWRIVSITEALKTCLQRSYLSSRQRDSINIGYLRAKIVIVGNNKRVKMYPFEAQIYPSVFSTY